MGKKRNNAKKKSKNKKVTNQNKTIADTSINTTNENSLSSLNIDNNTETLPKDTISEAKPNKSFVRLAITSAAIMTLVTGSYMAYTNTANYSDASFDGIFVENTNVGGLTKSEIREVVTPLLNKKIDENPIKILINGSNIEIKPSDIGLKFDIDSITNEILNHDKTGNNLIDTVNRLLKKTMPSDMQFIATFDEKKLDSYLRKLNKKYSIEPVNAKFGADNKKLSVSTHKDGYAIDTSKLKEDIVAVIQDNFTTNAVTANIIESSPVLTKNVAESMEVLGTFKTKLPSKTGDRTKNIKLFMSKLNNVVLAPGEEFSSDKRAGSREIKDGYRPAPGYSNGEVVQIVAGGICQGVTTLYNALLYADVNITERHPHSMPVTYSQNGRDAAIAKGYKDLKFTNNTENPIVVQAYVDNNGYVVASIIGIQENPDKKIEISVNHINSKAANAYKKTYMNGELVKTDLLSKDRYR